MRSSALREAIVDIDKDVKVNVEGFPVCRMRELRELNSKAAVKACSESVIGKGSADAELAPSEQSRAMRSDLMPLPLTVFNGGEKGGGVTLLIHTFITVPAPTAIVATVTISRKGSGLHAVAKVPVIAEGSGSLLDFKLKLGKTYSFEGEKVGYFEAKCPDGIFKADIPRLLFKNETRESGVPAVGVFKGSVAVPCTPKG